MRRLKKLLLWFIPYFCGLFCDSIITTQEISFKVRIICSVITISILVSGFMFIYESDKIKCKYKHFISVNPEKEISKATPCYEITGCENCIYKDKK